MYKILTVLYVFLLIIVFNFLDASVDISARVREEIKRQLSEVSDENIHRLTPKRISKKVSSSVKKEIKRQMFNDFSKVAKQSIYDESLDPVDLIYKSPRWPVEFCYFLKKDLLNIDINFNWATKSYGSSGGTKDVSNLVFQEEPIYFKNIVLASKLLENSVVTLPGGLPNNYGFLSVLKDQQLIFDASVQSQNIDISYVRHFLRGDIALGFTIPIVRRVHKIKLTSSIDSNTKESLKTNSKDFYSNYSLGLIDLFKSVLEKKKISFNENDTEVGLGDISLFFNWEIPSRRCERCLLGFDLSCPTSRGRDVYKLWDPELGNGGFTELSLFGSVMFSPAKVFNPHMFLKFTQPISTKVFRRVPEKKSKSDLNMTDLTSAGGKLGDDYIIYGNNVRYDATTTQPEFSELDSIVKRFATGTQKTKISRGSSVLLRIGNIIEIRRFFIDIFYDLYAKGKDYIGFRRPDDKFDPSILTKNTFELSHKIGTDLSWQIDDSWRLRLSGQYTFAGRNTLQLFEVGGTVSFEF